MTSRNRCDASIARRLATALFVAVAGLVAAQAPAAAQITVSAGYTYMPGRIGDSRSEHGPTARLDFKLVSASWVRLSLEGGVDFLNQIRSERVEENCILPGGASGVCYFDSRDRDIAFSGAVVARFGPQGAGANPYLLLGAGITTVRTKFDQVATDANGNVLQNFTLSGNSGDDGLIAPLGLGVSLPWGNRAVLIEARATPIVNNYSGGIQFHVIPSLTFGVRF